MIIWPSASRGASDRATVACALPPVTTMTTSAPSTADCRSFVARSTGANPDVGKPLIVDVVQAQFEPGDPELCREINPANAGADDCHRLDRVSIRHDRLLRPLYEPAG